MRHPFLRTLAGSGVTTDPNFENVTLLLHGDGTNGGQNNTFVDGSTNNFTITRNGNTTQGTFSPYGDNWSNYFDGTNDYFSLADNAALEPGSSDLTWEAWINTTLDRKDAMLYARGTSYGAGVWLFLINSASSTAGDVALWLGDYSASVPLLVTSGVSVRDGAWHHLALVRNGSSWAIYIDGVSRATATWSGTISDIAVGATIARDALVPTTRDYQGYISNLRIIKGTAVYTSNFTPPTAPLTAITNTSLLTCQSNRFRDASSNNFTITSNGDVSVQRFSPFSPSAAYASGTIGGGGYFDGTGDYLYVPYTAAFNLSSGDFTIEGWFYANSFASVFNVIAKDTAGTNFDWAILVVNNTTIIWYTAGTAQNLTATVPAMAAKAWYHVAFVRSSGTNKIYLNGISYAQNTMSITNASQTRVTIGCNGWNSPQNFINGYLSDVRLVKGTAIYTANFTPPTAPLTAVANTSLLLNFTNAAILDNAMMAVPETVGNAQIDTTIKKYGTGSLEFDGNGDYLRVRTSPELDLVTGNFTIEFWVYLNSLSSGNRTVLSKDGVSGSSYAQYALRFNTNGTLTATIGSGNGISYNQAFTSTTAFSTATWYHVALVRSGTTVSLYVNGTSEASATQTGTMTTGNKALLIGWEESQPLAHYLDGYIDDLRITKGVARYTSNFTAPTAAFPDL